MADFFFLIRARLKRSCTLKSSTRQSQAASRTLNGSFSLSTERLVNQQKRVRSVWWGLIHDHVHREVSRNLSEDDKGGYDSCPHERLPEQTLNAMSNSVKRRCIGQRLAELSSRAGLKVVGLSVNVVFILA